MCTMTSLDTMQRMISCKFKTLKPDVLECTRDCSLSEFYIEATGIEADFGCEAIHELRCGF